MVHLQNQCEGGLLGPLGLAVMGSREAVGKTDLGARHTVDINYG